MISFDVTICGSNVGGGGGNTSPNPPDDYDPCNGTPAPVPTVSYNGAKGDKLMVAETNPCDKKPLPQLPEDQLPDYQCDCDCPEEVAEMTDALLAYEPKWGQLGNKQSIKNEINKITSITGFNNLSLKTKLSDLKEHFFADRMYTRDFQNNLIDAPNSRFVDRYIYIADRGWIDMHHFFYAAYLAESSSPLIAAAATSSAEVIQSILSNQSNSSFSYEDKPSNLAGIDFWVKYHNNLENGTMDIKTAIDHYLTLLNAKEPTEAPNFNYIPHIIDGLAPKNKNYKGLTGEELRALAKESYCKKTLQARMNIWEAHKKFSYSAH